MGNTNDNLEKNGTSEETDVKVSADFDKHTVTISCGSEQTTAYLLEAVIKVLNILSGEED